MSFGPQIHRHYAHPDSFVSWQGRLGIVLGILWPIAWAAMNGFERFTWWSSFIAMPIMLLASLYLFLQTLAANWELQKQATKRFLKRYAQGHPIGWIIAILFFLCKTHLY